MWQVSGILGLSLLLSLGAFKLYYDKSEAEKKQVMAELKQSQSNSQLLKEEIAKSNSALEDHIKKEEQRYREIESLSRQLAAARQETDNLKKTFAKHDLNYLSLKKPGLIEKIINKGTAKVNAELEDITSVSSD